MASDGLCWMPASEMAAAIRRKKVSPVEVMKEVLARIDRLNPTLNAFVTLTAEQAMRDARAAERALGKKGAKLGPLHGVPFSTKDLVLTKGIRTTFGTRLYADNVPTETAPMVERMLAAGAIQLGKTNTPTFGWIGATHNLLFGVTRNPWNLDRTPGGSSGARAPRWPPAWGPSPSARTAEAPSGFPRPSRASSVTRPPTDAFRSRGAVRCGAFRTLVP